MAHSPIDLNHSLKEILEAKLRFHTEQLAFHKEELKHTSQAMLFFKQQQEETISKGQDLQGTVFLQTHPSKSEEVPSSGTERITQRVARPHVERFFKYHTGQYTTAEMFDLLKKEHGWKDADRAKWISAISSTLNTLVAYKKVISYETGIGRIKKYEANNTRIKEDQELHREMPLFETKDPG